MTNVGRHSDHSQDMGILRQRRLAGAFVLLGLPVNIGDCTNCLFLAMVIGNVVMERNGHFLPTGQRYAKSFEPYQLIRINLSGANPGILGSDHLPSLSDQHEHHSANSLLGKIKL